MEELYNLAQYFIDNLSRLGDWLLNEPLNVLPDNVILRNIHLLGLDWMGDFLLSIKDASIASMIFGGSLVGILTFRLVKFILDIVL